MDANESYEFTAGPRIAPMYQGILGTAMQVPPPAPHPHRGNQAIESVLRDIKDAMKQVHPLHHSPTHQEDEDDPVWIPRYVLLILGESKNKIGTAIDY